MAVRAHDGCLTYRELSDRADGLARELVRRGARPRDLVGLCLERSAALVVAALGIVRAGCAYVAVDPRYPDDRVRWMLEDSSVGAVVADPASAARLDAGGGPAMVVCATGGELLDDAPATGADEPLLGEPGPNDIAYVVYTSGSTGRPKGVPVEHAGLVNLVGWHIQTFALGPADRCTQISSPGFDAAVWEIWPSLASGASIHVVPEALRGDPLGLRDWLVTERITVTFLPTAVAEAVIGLSWPHDVALRHLLTGGDALTRRPPPGLPFELVNNYGLSETAVVATSGVVAPEGEAQGPPSIGRPIDGVVAEVVDEQLRPVAPGAEGELVIGGAAVSPGYLNRDDLTAERFLGEGRQRRYRTGDHVRLRADGELDFLGRADDQLSIRGFRVEAGEVAAALEAHPAIRASVPVGAGGSSGERRLVAYVVADGAERPSHDELASFLGRSLPEHMVPSQFVWLDELPLNEHGKIDRGALAAAPETPASPTGAEAGTSIEAQTAAIVAELLGIDAVGPDENFFLLGGHSMLGAQLIARLEALFDVEISLRHLFDHPTPAAVAAEVERQMTTRS